MIHNVHYRVNYPFNVGFKCFQRCHLCAHAFKQKAKSEHVTPVLYMPLSVILSLINNAHLTRWLPGGTA